jgi:hypothetical protein
MTIVPELTDKIVNISCTPTASVVHNRPGYPQLARSRSSSPPEARKVEA